MTDPIPPAPPAVTRSVLRQLFAPEDRDCAVSDLDEEFEARAVRDGVPAARRWYRDQARRSIGPALRRRLMAAPPSFRIDITSDLRWAWRGVRARGWRAVFVAGILAVALAANAAMFSVTDSLLFNTQPFPDTGRIVSLRGRVGLGERLTESTTPRLFHGWTAQTDVFAAFGSYMHKTVFLTGNGRSEQITTADFTTSMLDVLGVKPDWGRSFVSADLEDAGHFAALIREDLAREKFGSPGSALGQQLESTGRPLIVVGVMSNEFAFPNASVRIWRAFAPGGPLTRSHGQSTVARLTAESSIEAGLARVVARAPTVGRAAGLSTYTAEAAPSFRTPTPSERRTLLLLLLGASLCLLIAACANAASLELANAVQRARIHAVQLAIGAGRLQLARVAALEGLTMIGLALTAGVLIAVLTIPLVATSLPDVLRFSTRNPISLDQRVIWFTAALAAITWLLSSLAPVLAASRPSLVSLLKTEDRTSATSAASGRMRRWLTGAQVALAVMLISGGMLYASSYQRLLAVDKGFDSRGLAEVRLSMPAGFFHAGNTRAQFIERFSRALAAVPGVQGITDAAPPPSVGDGASPATLEVDGRPIAEPMMLGRKHIDPDFFRIVGLPLKRGRLLQAGDPATDVVIGEALARRLWPDIDAVGRTFRGVGNSTIAQDGVRVVGVVGDFRTAATRLPDPTDSVMHVYTLLEPPRSRRSVGQPEPLLDTGSMSNVAVLTVRLNSPDQLASLLAATRRFEPGLEATATSVDDLYARQNSNTRLAREVVGAFSALAFLIAIVGVYGVMAFLVAGRRREIGIRMALGASREDIRKLVLGSSMRLVIAGALIGSIGTAIASRWIKTQLFGTSAADPASWIVVLFAVLVVSVLGTWHPASQAARVDPAITLRTE